MRTQIGILYVKKYCPLSIQITLANFWYHSNGFFSVNTEGNLILSVPQNVYSYLKSYHFHSNVTKESRMYDEPVSNLYTLQLSQCALDLFLMQRDPSCNIDNFASIYNWSCIHFVIRGNQTSYFSIEKSWALCPSPGFLSQPDLAINVCERAVKPDLINQSSYLGEKSYHWLNIVAFFK